LAGVGVGVGVGVDVGVGFGFGFGVLGASCGRGISTFSPFNRDCFSSCVRWMVSVKDLAFCCCC